MAVPVILLFTKFETQDSEAFEKLQSEGKKTLEEAHALAEKSAEEKFKSTELQRFTNRKYPPKDIIYLRSKISSSVCY